MQRPLLLTRDGIVLTTQPERFQAHCPIFLPALQYDLLLDGGRVDLLLTVSRARSIIGDQFCRGRYIRRSFTPAIKLACRPF